MAEWTPRTVVDQQVEFPYRYQMKDTESGEVIGTYDITPVRSDGDVEGTQINSAYLQPIEDFLGEIKGELDALGIEIVNVQSNLDASVASLSSSISATETRLNGNINAVDGKITTANQRMDTINTTIGTLAPKVNPTLTNPRANTIAITANNTALATTAAVKTYLDGLMAAYRG